MPALAFPPFPDDVPTVPLLIIDYSLIKAKDANEIDRLWEAATKLGFWYLKNHGVEDEVNGMFDMCAETMSLPLEEKMKYEQGDEGNSYGYKYAGANATDEKGTLDRVEFIIVAEDDALSYPTPVHRTYPSTVNARMENTIRPFTQKSMEVNLTLIDVLNDKLGLPQGELVKMHINQAVKGGESRCTKSPKHQVISEESAVLGAHTDFGSLTFLHNRLGGLQVLPPGADEWKYVKPIPNHAVCNVADGLTIFSGGILRSNLHRVMPPPGAQAAYERWSCGFFTRPGSSVVLSALIDGSEMIKEAVEKATPEVKATFNTGVTSGDWFRRRIKNHRIKNRKGPETWKDSRGTEHRGGIVSAAA